MAKAYILMAQGFEEMELVITVDILRRAGIDVQTVTLGSDPLPVLGSRGIAMVPDLCLAQIDLASCDALVLPGGLEGTRNLGENPKVLELVRQAFNDRKRLAAICAAPTVLVRAGVARGWRMTSHPGAKDQMGETDYTTDRVVMDGPFITSRAAGTSFEFAFKLVEILAGKEKVGEVNRGVLALFP